MKFNFIQACVVLAMIIPLGGCAGNSGSSAGNSPTPTVSGSVTNYNGVDIWQDSFPNRNYKVLSTIQTTSRSDISPQNGLFQTLAQKARAAGGNGVIILSNTIQTTGGQMVDPGIYTPGLPSMVVNGSVAVTKAQIIRYIPKAGTPPAPGSPQ
jgi:hypothetical protein